MFHVSNKLTPRNLARAFGPWRAVGYTGYRRYINYMCERVRLSSGVSEIRIAFRIPPERLIPNFPPNWNAAPTDSLPVVRYDTKAGQRSLDLLRWGLIPHWAKDINVGFANINAKAEGIENKPGFRQAFERRRVPDAYRQLFLNEALSDSGGSAAQIA